MVFQNYALFPHMTRAQECRLRADDARRRRGRRSQRRVEEAIGLVRLKGQEGKLPGQLSGGQQQRVAIARAIVVEPPLVLMDEPLSNLDAKLRLEMRAEIRRIHNTLGATTIYVTHDQEEALSLADRIVVLRDGEVRQVGDARRTCSAGRTISTSPSSWASATGSRGGWPSADGERATVEAGGARLTGRMRQTVTPGGRATIVVRPDDLHPVAAGHEGVQATVAAAEFRGREFVGFARTPDGADLAFRSERRVEAGEPVVLGADPDRVLVYAEA